MNNIHINNNNNNQFIQVSMDLAEHSGFTNWGDYKSNRITTNQFLVSGGEQSTQRKTSQRRAEHQQTQPTYDSWSENWTWVILVEGECSHHSANPAFYLKLLKLIAER